VTPWDADVKVAVDEAMAGRGNPDVARVLAAEIHRLDAVLADALAWISKQKEPAGG
jgi:hypothetical protein